MLQLFKRCKKEKDMDKLALEFLETCNSDNCCFDNLLVLPADGDVGFEEYIDYKVKKIIKKKNIFSPADQHKLVLAYPEPDAPDVVFNLFFESPSVVAKNDHFRGCFAIDVTEYLGKTDHPRFKTLLNYIGTNTDIVFVLIVCTDNEQYIMDMLNTVCQYDKFRKVTITLPPPEYLCKYTMEEISDVAIDLKETRKILLGYFKENRYGYDVAEFLVIYLKNAGYNGETENLKKLLGEFENPAHVTVQYKKIGF
jgi:hypothetical protein